MGYDHAQTKRMEPERCRWGPISPLVAYRDHNDWIYELLAVCKVDTGTWQQTKAVENGEKEAEENGDDEEFSFALPARAGGVPAAERCGESEHCLRSKDLWFYRWADQLALSEERPVE